MGLLLEMEFCTDMAFCKPDVDNRTVMEGGQPARSHGIDLTLALVSVYAANAFVNFTFPRQRHLREWQDFMSEKEVWSNDGSAQLGPAHQISRLSDPKSNPCRALSRDLDLDSRQVCEVLMCQSIRRSEKQASSFGLRSLHLFVRIEKYGG
jgi:hypothetical protein